MRPETEEDKLYLKESTSKLMDFVDCNRHARNPPSRSIRAN